MAGQAGSRRLQLSPALLLIDACAVDAMPSTNQLDVKATEMIQRCSLPVVMTETVGSELFGEAAFRPGFAGHPGEDGKKTIFKSYDPKSKTFELKPWDEIKNTLKEPYKSDRASYLDRCKSAHELLSTKGSLVTITDVCKQKQSGRGFNGYGKEQGELSIAQVVSRNPNPHLIILTHDRGLALDIHNQGTPFPGNVSILDVNGMAHAANLSKRITGAQQDAIKNAVMNSEGRPPRDLFEKIGQEPQLYAVVKRLDNSPADVGNTIIKRDGEYAAFKAAQTTLQTSGIRPSEMSAGETVGAPSKTTSVAKPREPEPAIPGMPGKPSGSDNKR